MLPAALAPVARCARVARLPPPSSGSAAALRPYSSPFSLGLRFLFARWRAALRFSGALPIWVLGFALRLSPSSPLRGRRRRSRACGASAVRWPTGSHQAYGLPSSLRAPVATAPYIHRPVFVGWRCSPLGLCSALPLLGRRGFPLGRCRACPRSTIDFRFSLSALPRVLLLYVLPTRARWARGAAGVGWRGPPACLRPLRVRPRASLRSPAPCRPAYGTVLRVPSRPAGARPSLHSGQRVRQVARCITPAAVGAFSQHHFVTSPRARPPRATLLAKPSPTTDNFGHLGGCHR